MDTAEYHRRILRGCVRVCGADPDGPLAPNIEGIANGDESLHTKVRRVARATRENVRQGRRAS